MMLLSDPDFLKWVDSSLYGFTLCRFTLSKFTSIDERSCGSANLHWVDGNVSVTYVKMKQSEQMSMKKKCQNLKLTYELMTACYN